MAVSMPSPSTSTFNKTQRFQVVLVPLDDGAVLHGRVFHRYQLRQRSAGDHKAAHVLRQVPGKTEDLIHQ